MAVAPTYRPDSDTEIQEEFEQRWESLFVNPLDQLETSLAGEDAPERPSGLESRQAAAVGQ
jgi:hypothetical protein